MAPTTHQKRATFRALHESGCFLIPNPWDVGSARYLESLGFQALATTSSGMAWSAGQPDGHVPLDRVLAHLQTLVDATSVPINADFGNGFADDPERMAANVRRAVATGVAGLSIEDATGDPQRPLYDLMLAVERLQAARQAIDATGEDVLLIGRAENFLFDRPDLDDTLKRLKAYADAGADCLYAPGIRSEAQIRAVVEAVAPKPVNVLIGFAAPFGLEDLERWGVRRVSVGGALARSAWGETMRVARSLAEGRFDGFASAAAHKDLDALFASSPSCAPLESVQRLAAFSDGTAGGNPAGVHIADAMPDTAAMQAIAAEVGYSETAFAAPQGDGWRVRYFAPESEVPFCGHATIALGAALGERHGDGVFKLRTNHADITVEGERDGEVTRAALQSPGTRSTPMSSGEIDETLALFGYTADQLDPRYPPVRAEAGAAHFMLALSSRDALTAMRYDLAEGRDFMRRHGIVTVAWLVAESPDTFHARNPFASGGVYEDPATGAAAAAWAGYLRDTGLLSEGPIDILQGFDMGSPSRLRAAFTAEPGSSIRVSGTVRKL